MLINTALLVLAYLFGSLTSAVLICKIARLDDPRQHGSNNPGATNVLRLYGKKTAALVFSADVLKGVIPVCVGRAFDVPDSIIAGIGSAAFIGHVYPLFFGFRGGKGVATLIGVLLATYWPLGLAYIGTWLVFAGIFRYASLASLMSAVMTFVYVWLLVGFTWFTASVGLMTMLLFWRHRANLINLLAGKERRLVLR